MWPWAKPESKYEVHGLPAHIIRSGGIRKREFVWSRVKLYSSVLPMTAVRESRTCHCEQSKPKGACFVPALTCSQFRRDSDMQFVDKALARRFEACEEMPQVLYARVFQKTRPGIG